MPIPDEICKSHEFSKYSMDMLRKGSTDRVQCMKCKTAFTEQEYDLLKHSKKESSKGDKEE